MLQPARKKKPFIDKKNAITFHLVHRSQKDPLQADEDAPQRVLLPSLKDSKVRDTYNFKTEITEKNIFREDLP